MKRILYTLALILTAQFSFSQKAPKPPMMGLSTWNAYRAEINDSIIRAQADNIIAKGLRSAGYQYLNIDDGFFAGRDAQGNVKVSTSKFPNGMKVLADYIHSKGLKAGIYSDAGPNTCASIWENPPETGGIGAGLYQHVQQDIDLYFKDWGFDYIKVDYCGASQQSLKLDEETHYTKIKQALDATGVEDYAYIVCRWDFPGTWVTKIADSWRISYDIAPNFDRMLYILDLNTFLAPFMSPGHYNDMDMLEIGNGNLTYNENVAQMSLWAVLTSPLVIGADLDKISQQTLDILKNEEVIAVNQDMTEQGHLISDFGKNLQVWSKKLNGKQSGERAVVLFNRNSSSTRITLNFADIDLAPQVTIRDLWKHEDLGEFNTSYSAVVPGHGVVMLKISGTNVNPTVYEAEYAYLHNFNHLVNTEPIPNQARATASAAASKAAIVTNVGGNADNYIEFRDIFVDETGTFPLTISYLSGDDRSATLTVNGAVVETDLFNSGGSSLIGSQSVYVTLQAGVNTIRFENTTAMAPDFDKITIGPKDGPLPGHLTLEAEEATLEGDLIILDNSLASNKKVVAGLGESAENKIIFEAFELANSTGIYAMKLFFESTQKKTLNIIINGKAYSLDNLISPENSMGWVELLVSLKKGSNNIRLESNSAAPAIDKIEFDLSRNHGNMVNLEAENGQLITSNNQPRISDKAGASGGKVVGWLGNSATYRIVFDDVKVKVDGKYDITLYYFSGEARKVTLKINGEEHTFSNLNSGSWDSRGSSTLKNIELQSTGNSIEIYNATAWAPDIDNIELDGSALMDGQIVGSNMPTGTKNIQANSFTLYPNPNSGQFTITSNTAQTVQVFDISGSKIQSISLKEGKNTLNLSSLSKGVYLLQGDLECKRLILN